MKINGSDLQSKLNAYQRSHANSQPVGTVKSNKIKAFMPRQDRVALSERGQSIADAQRAVASIPDVRQSLVSRIRADMHNGAYVIDLQKAAEGLLRESMVNQAAMG